MQRKSWLVRNAESAERARRVMGLRGVTPSGHPLWKDWEVGPLVDRYPDYRSIFPLLTRRTSPAAYSKAGRLGITKSRGRPWDDPNEIWRLKIYRNGTREEILAAFPGRSWGAIAKAANKRGFRRSRTKEAETGILLLDQILARASANGYSLRDLDNFSRSGNYFRRRGWRTHPDASAHCRAARALGGTVRASFR